MPPRGISLAWPWRYPLSARDALAGGAITFVFVTVFTYVLTRDASDALLPGVASGVGNALVGLWMVRSGADSGPRDE